MKKALFLLLILLSLNHLSFSQKLVQPSEGKSIVCIVPVCIEHYRNDSYSFLTDEKKISWMELNTNYKLKFFDNEIYLGKYQSYNLYYECDPEEHLFWINPLSYIEAELLPNKVYIVYILVQYISPTYALPYGYQHPIHPDNLKLFSNISSIKDLKIRNFPDTLSLNMHNNYKKIIEVVLQKKRKIKQINELKRKSKILYDYKLRAKEPIPKLLPDMYIEIPEKIFTE